MNATATVTFVTAVREALRLSDLAATRAAIHGEAGSLTRDARREAEAAWRNLPRLRSGDAALAFFAAAAQGGARSPSVALATLQTMTSRERAALTFGDACDIANAGSLASADLYDGWGTYRDFVAPGTVVDGEPAPVDEVSYRSSAGTLVRLTRDGRVSVTAADGTPHRARWEAALNALTAPPAPVSEECLRAIADAALDQATVAVQAAACEDHEVNLAILASYRADGGRGRGRAGACAALLVARLNGGCEGPYNDLPTGAPAALRGLS